MAVVDVTNYDSNAVPVRDPAAQAGAISVKLLRANREFVVRALFGLCAIALVASGCSDPKKASKANFEKVINDHLAKTPACLRPPHSPVTPANANGGVEPFPAYVDNEPGTPAQQKYKATSAKPFDALVQAGLLKMSTGLIDVQSWSPVGPKPRKAVKIYDLTDEGRKSIATEQEARFGKGFCYGTPEVVEIVRYTEPSSGMGMTLSEVNYTYRLKDPAKWAADPAVIDAFPELKSRTGEKMEGRTALVLTNEGWAYPS